MKKTMIAATILGLAWGAATAEAGEFKAESAAFADGKVKPAQFANVFGCAGANVSPDISWSNAPAGTKSFVVTLYDKDAPTGSGFWHWVVVDIPADVTALKAGGALPKGAHFASNDASMAGFLGACPPPGETHEYRLEIKALKIETLPVPENATGALVGFVANMNKLADASVVAKG